MFIQQAVRGLGFHSEFPNASSLNYKDGIIDLAIEALLAYLGKSILDDSDRG